jgi:hypothetical protein
VAKRPPAFEAWRVSTTKDDGGYTAETDQGFEYLMDAKDVDYWRGSNIPVVVLVHLGTDKAWWKSVETGEGPRPWQLRNLRA